MEREQIIRMAREAGMERVHAIHADGTKTIELPHPDTLEHFAALIAAAEREACAKIVEGSRLPDAYSEPVLFEIADDIRTRGEK